MLWKVTKGGLGSFFPCQLKANILQSCFYKNIVYENLRYQGDTTYYFLARDKDSEPCYPCSSWPLMLPTYGWFRKKMLQIAG